LIAATSGSLKPALDAALARFQMMQKMRVDLTETRRAREERKFIGSPTWGCAVCNGTGGAAFGRLARRWTVDMRLHDCRAQYHPARHRG
jgi:response regulator NasT